MLTPLATIQRSGQSKPQYAVMPVTRDVRNAVLAEVHRLGMRPAEFEWIEVVNPIYSSNGSVAIRHTGADSFYFVFASAPVASGIQKDRRCMSEFYPGVKRPIEQVAGEGSADQLAACLKWLQRVKELASLPDLWAEAAKEDVLSTGAESEPDRPFTEEEKRDTAQALQELQRYLETVVHLNAQQHEITRDRLEYLRLALDRLTKRDWANIAWGIIVKIALACGAEHFRDVLAFGQETIGRALGWLHDAGTKLLGGP